MTPNEKLHKIEQSDYLDADDFDWLITRLRHFEKVLFDTQRHLNTICLGELTSAQAQDLAWKTAIDITKSME